MTTSSSRLSLRSNISSGLNEKNVQKLSDEMILRKYTVLPNIRRSESTYSQKSTYQDDYYYRPGGALPINDQKYNELPPRSDEKSRISNNKSSMHNHRSSKNNTPTSKNDTLYHFAAPKNLNKETYHLHETMDLDEDLPIHRANSMKQTTTRTSYTTPIERLQSPINRPPAPSPSKSKMKHYSPHDTSDSEDSLI